MTSELQTDQQRFHQFAKTLYGDCKLSDSLQRLRAKYWDKFLELGLPDRKSEVFRYVNLRQLFSKEYTAPNPHAINAELIEPYFLPEAAGAVIVFVNGFYQPELSDLRKLQKNVTIASLTEAMKAYGSLLNNQAAQRLQKEQDPFVSLNGALNVNGSFIYIAPKTRLEFPIQILQIISSSEMPVMMAPKLEIFLGAHSEVSFVSTVKHVSGKNYFVNSSINFAVEDNAKCSLTQTACGLANESWYFEGLRAALKRDSILKTVCITDGSQGTRFDYRVDLLGENSESSLNSLWVLKDKREAHHHVLMNHQAEGCRSMQYFKGVLDDASHSSFEGKIYVHKEAQKTQAFQLNNNLILSDLARAESKPNLEIFADDVKASHGATVGQLDENELFYLRTRGLTEEEAKQFLILGFCNEIIEMIPIDSLLKAIAKVLHRQDNA